MSWGQHKADESCVGRLAAHQEAHEAQVGIARAEAAQVKDAQDGFAVLRHRLNRALQQVRAQPLAVLQRPLACSGTRIASVSTGQGGKFS